MKVIFTKGIQSSGKTSFSKQLVKEDQTFKRVCRDDIRHMLSNYTFDDNNEKLVTKIERESIRSLILSGYNLVIDKMNLNTSMLNDDLSFIKDVCFVNDIETVDFEIKEFPISLIEAIERDKKRDFVIGEAIIKKTWKKYEVELKQMIERAEHKYIEDEDLPHCIICDIDGTLSNSSHRRIFNSTYDEIMEDKIIEQVRDLVNHYYKDIERDIFIFSGRSEDDRKVTEDWLNRNYVYYNKLVMRQSGDIRQDTIVKKEMFEEHIRGKYYCEFVVDDRPCVLEMYQNLGVFTLNVNQDVYAKNDF
jgi:predicted kinase